MPVAMIDGRVHRCTRIAVAAALTTGFPAQP
jgi:hypothetical protein